MATYPNRRAQLVDALRHRLTEVEKRRTPADDAERDRLVGELAQAARRAVAEFDATFDAHVVKRLTDVLVVSHEKTAQIVDARPAPRFNAEADEPRPGLKRGHIPGALNVPWGDLVFEGELKTTDELRAIFDRAGVDLHRPIIASCGSGVTAAVVVLALTTLGVNGVCLYDGSWSEWGARSDLPIEPAQ